MTVVAHPCDETSLRGAIDAAAAGLIDPVLVGPEAKIRAVAAEHGIDLAAARIVDAPHSHAAAAQAVALIREGKGELLMKGSLHTDELMKEVAASATGLRTDRRISHVFVMDVPGHPETLFITDAAINIFPTLDDKRDIIQNAIDLWTGIGIGTPQVAILSAVETVTTKIPSTIEAAALCKMAERGQITGGLLDGPLAFDNAIDPEAARIKGIAGPVAGHGQILVVPDLEAGNMLAKNLTFLAHADAAGIVLGARVPIVLTSRADSVRTRLASCAVAALYANARRAKPPVPAADGDDPRRQRRLVEPEVPALRRRTAALERRVRGQIDGIGVHPRLRATDAAGATLVDRELRAGRLPDLPAAIEATRAWFATLDGVELAPSATASCTAAPTSTGPCASTRPSSAGSTRYESLAPLHQPNNLAPIRLAMEIAPDCRRSPASTPPSTAATRRFADCYAIPRALYDEGVRRYGFHGLSYEYVAHRLARGGAGDRRRPGHRRPPRQRRLDVRDRGRAQRREHDGLHRARRPADGHPAGPARPRRRAPPDRGEGDDRGRGHALLYNDAGLKGLSGISNDMRDLLASDDPGAAFAIDHFVYRCGLHAGALAAALGGLDAFVFTAGIGENSAPIRARIAERLPGSAPSSTPPPTRPARSASRRRRAASPSSSSRPTRS